MKMFYNVVNFCAREARQNGEKLHSVQGLQCMIKKSPVVLFTSDVMYN